MKKYLDKILKYGKLLFIICVSILIVVEFTKIKKEISFQELNDIINSLGIIKLVFLAVLGIIAVLPMLNYDVIFNKMVNSGKNLSYILPRSITINTLNNLMGFGGIINIGLRMQYFAEEKDKKSTMRILPKIFLFFFAGCSFLSIIGLVHVISIENSILKNYIPWLIVGILYYPVALLVSKYKDKEEIFFSKSVFVKLSVTSIFEWGIAFIFFMTIAYFLNIDLSLLDILTVYIISILVGLLSMMPGGIGSFDLMALTSFTAMGVESEKVLSWLMLFRLFYYIVPFFIGTAFFIKNTRKFFSQKKENAPSRILQSLSLDLLSIMIYLLGIFLIISASVPDDLFKIKWLSGFNRIHSNMIYQFPSVLLGCFYILLGRACKNKVVRAFKPSLILLSLGLIYAILSKFGIFTVVHFIISIILLNYVKKEFRTMQLVYSFEDITKDSFVYLFTILLTIILGTHNYAGPHFIKRIKEFILLPFEDNLIKISVIILLMFLLYYLLLNYLKSDKYKIGVEPNCDDITPLLDTHSNSTEAALAYLGDKDIFYYEDENNVKLCALQIFTINDKVIVMGEPFGDKRYYKKLVEKFIQETDLYGYSPVFYEISREFTMDLHDCGFSFMKFGEFGYVNLNEFNLQGSHKSAFRNVMNKFKKNNFAFEVISPPYSDDVIAKLKEISDKWLGERAEKGFSLGFFKEDYLQRCDIAVCKSDVGEIIAFANIMPLPSSEWVTIDLMRFDHDNAPVGTMDFLFINLFLYFKDTGKKFFNLGMAPLSNVGINENSFVQEKLAFLIYKFSDKFYSFKGLRTYKQKFASDWQPVYISFCRKSWLLYTLMSLFMVDILAKKNSDNSESYIQKNNCQKPKK